MELKKSTDRSLMCILEAKTKDQVLIELIELMAAQGRVRHTEDLAEKIFYREKLMSTGIGLGIAVPHVRVEGISNPITAIGVSPDGIADYESIDDELVRIVVMIVAGKTQHKEYIRLLSEIVTKLKEDHVIERLYTAENPDEIYDILMGPGDA